MQTPAELLDMIEFVANEPLVVWDKPFDNWNRDDFVLALTNLRVIRDTVREYKSQQNVHDITD